MFRNHLSRIGVLATVLALAAVTAGPAAADPAGQCPPVSGCIPDDFNHNFCFSAGTSSTVESRGQSAMQHLDEQTGYSDSRVGCTSTTDVMIKSGELDPGVRGNYVCTAKNSAGKCERSVVTANWKELYDGINWTKTLCHEIGHSVGLDHGEGGDHGSPVDCMRSGSVSTWTVTYNDHHVWHANARKVY